MICVDYPSYKKPLDEGTELMLALQRDDEHALAQLMDLYSKYVRWLLRERVGNLACEDAVQEIFMRVYRARETYVPTAKFKTWLSTITRNFALNLLRSHKRKERLESMLIGQERSAALLSDGSWCSRTESQRPLDDVIVQETQEQVLAALEKIGERQRTAVLLVYFQGFSWSESAAMMGTTSVAIKGLLSRARDNLRLHLTDVHALEST